MKKLLQSLSISLFAFFFLLLNPPQVNAAFNCRNSNILGTPSYDSANKVYTVTFNHPQLANGGSRDDHVVEIQFAEGIGVNIPLMSSSPDDLGTVTFNIPIADISSNSPQFFTGGGNRNLQLKFRDTQPAATIDNECAVSINLSDADAIQMQSDSGVAPAAAAAPAAAPAAGGLECDPAGVPADGDNDGDGYPDCTRCGDSSDNDGDSLTDCADPDCFPAAHCSSARPVTSPTGLSSTITGADCPGILTGLGPIPTDPECLAKWFLQSGVMLGGGIAFILSAFGGITIILAGGNPEKINQGKEMITSALSGLIIIIMAVVLLRFIGVDILGLPDFV